VVQQSEPPKRQHLLVTRVGVRRDLERWDEAHELVGHVPEAGLLVGAPHVVDIGFQPLNGRCLAQMLVASEVGDLAIVHQD
jgi:hypothetical protein